LYNSTFKPQIERKVRESKEATSDASASLENRHTVVLINIPVACAGAAHEIEQGVSFWYSVQVMVNGKPFGTAFTAPRMQVGKQGGPNKAQEFRGLQLNAGCDPGVVTGAMQVHVEIDRSKR
jgi:hypothetical protein